MAVTLILRNPLDGDAREYISRAGVTDSTAKLSINEFVRGVKGLSLWDKMVCWPLKSTQNAGTGTTAYSLGGLGTYNGAMVGGPTWGGGGITFDGSDDAISVGDTADLRVGNTDFSIAAWVNPDAVNGTQKPIVAKESGAGGSGQREYMLVVHSSNSFRFYVRSGETGDFNVSWGAAASAGQNAFVVAWHDSQNDTINIQVNNGTPVSVAYSSGVFSSTNPFQIGAQGTSTYWDGLVAFAGAWRTVLTSEQRTYLYNGGTPLL